jgi:hypothetical protein
MKRFNLLSVAVALVLLVSAVGCTTMTGTQDDRYDRVQSNRVYVDDPYRGTVVLERDPFTGRYYEVDSYGSTYNNRYYSRSRGYNSYGRNYNTYNRNYNRGRNTQQQPTQQQRAQNEQSRQEARKKVLGN